MTTSPPISTADRDKAKEIDLRDAIDRIVWYQGRGSTSVTDAIMAIVEPLEARVVELEAALKAERTLVAQMVELRFNPTGDNHHNAFACPYCNPKQISWEQYEASDARATALLEALRPFAEAAGAYDVLANPAHSDDLYLNGLLSAFPGISEARIRVGDLRAARRAIAAQQDRQTEG